MKRIKLFSFPYIFVNLLILAIIFLSLASFCYANNEIIMKFSHCAAPGSDNDEIVQFFKERVEELSNGRIKVEVYPSAQLGDKIQGLESVRAGTLEAQDFAATDFSGFKKRWSVFALPYLFMDQEQLFDRVLQDKEVLEMLNKDAEYVGLKILFWWTQGSRSFLNCIRPIYKPSDLKGMKIRVMQDPVLMQTISLMGASPVTLPWSEVYIALQQKTIDGLENDVSPLSAAKMHEAAKYFSLTEHFRIPNVSMMNLKFFNSLPKDLQDILIQVGQETTEESKIIRQKWTAAATKIFIDSGVQINEVDKNIFAKSVEPIYDMFLSNADQDTKDLFERIREIQ